MEDKIKFYEIANILDLDLEYDGDETDLRLQGREKSNWGAETAAEYEEATNAIDAISYKGNGWEVYATYDVSGFDYWMLQQEEPNYINMTVMFDTNTVDVTEITAIKNAMDMAYSDAYSIAEKYDYVPNSEYKRGGSVDGRSTRAKDTWNRGSAWTRDRNAHNKSEDWEKPMNKRKYAEGGGVGLHHLTGTAYYITEESAGSNYNYLSNSVLDIEEFNESLSDEKILTSYFDVNVKYDFQVRDAIYAEMAERDSDSENGYEMGRHIIGYKILTGNMGEFSNNLPYNDDEDDNEEYKRGGKVDGRSTRAKDTWNRGSAWTRDRNAHNKSENWEKPLNQRGKSVTKSSSSASSKSSSSASLKGKSKKYMYIPNYMIRGAEVNNSGKTTDIDGANILDGIYVKKGTKYAEGGGVGDKPLSYYKYSTPRVNMAWNGKIQQGGFYSAEEAMEAIKKQAQTKEELTHYSIVTPDKVIHIGKEYAIRYANGGGVESLISLGQGKYKYRDFQFRVEDGEINMTSPDFYEGQSIEGETPTLNEIKSIIADYFDFDNRDFPITKAEATMINKNFSTKEQDEIFGMTFADGGGVPDLDKKMALVNLDMIHEYSVKLDKMVTEETELEEWVKMKLTRIEQNIADVKHAVSGGEKFDGGGMIFKKQLLHISKYAKELIDMVQAGSNLMAWQENKLAIAADNIDGIYHYMDYLNHKNMDKFNEYLMRGDDEYKRGGKVPRNVGRDWIFKSKQKWEQDYDRKREYKEYKKEGWLANWFKEGGEAKDFDFDEFRKRQAIISEAVKFAFVRAIGFDDAYNLSQNEDFSISPYRLVERAVSGEFIGVHEINKDVVESAIDEARRVTGRYKDSGQGIGSSDMTAFLKNFLDDAGFKTAFISSRLERIDENGNAIKVKSDLPNTTMFKDGGEANSGYTPMGGIDDTDISEYVKKIRENRKAKGLGEMTQKEHSDLINELQEKFNTTMFKDGGSVRIEDIRQGDYVDFGSYGGFYVCNPSYSETYFWVTKEEENRYDWDAVGYSMPKSSAIKIIETGDEYKNGGRVKNYKYVPNYMIESVDVERNGKTTEIDGGNILDGLYVKNTKFEEGGYVENITTKNLESMIGRKLNGWNDDKVIFNGIVYKKCFMKPYYKIA